MVKEIWRDVKDYEGLYMVSNTGKIKSLDRTVISKKGFPISLKGRELSQISNQKNKGYLGVSFSKNCILKRRYVHQAVAQSFLGHEIDGFNKVIDHIDGNRENNNVNNLRIVSNRENNSSCYRDDRHLLTSKYTGVNFHKGRQKFRATIVFNGKDIHLGNFDKEYDAHLEYQRALSKIKTDDFDPSIYKRKYTSKYKGVHYNTKRERWIAEIKTVEKRVYIGSFKIEIDAHKAYQKALNNINNGLDPK